MLALSEVEGPATSTLDVIEHQSPLIQRTRTSGMPSPTSEITEQYSVHAAHTESFVMDPRAAVKQGAAWRRRSGFLFETNR